MRKPEPQYEKMEVPRLKEEVKKMNGKSTRKLKQCIDALCDVMDEPGRDGPQAAQDGSVSPQNGE